MKQTLSAHLRRLSACTQWLLKRSNSPGHDVGQVMCGSFQDVYVRMYDSLRLSADAQSDQRLRLHNASQRRRICADCSNLDENRSARQYRRTRGQARPRPSHYRLPDCCIDQRLRACTLLATVEV